jgi:DNA modification methylase
MLPAGDCIGYDQEQQIGMEVNVIYTDDALRRLKKLPDGCVRCIVTSPPYWGQRDYGVEGQLGMEATPELYVKRLVKILMECYRVLADDGTMWLNLGDSYAAGPKNRTAEQSTRKSNLMGGKDTQIQAGKQIDKVQGGLKPKDLVGVPWMVAFALRKKGWYLRCDVIWNKNNCMPESVTDRPTKGHEYIFLLSKSERYYYDYAAIKTFADSSSEMNGANATVADSSNGTGTIKKPIRTTDKQRGHSRRHEGFYERWDNMKKEEQMSYGANKRSVWTVATKPFKDAHFATFPPELIVDCVKAGSAVGDVVLDPFCGSGTTAEVALKLERSFVGIELNGKYVDIAMKRLRKSLGLFNRIVRG